MFPCTRVKKKAKRVSEKGLNVNSKYCEKEGFVKEFYCQLYLVRHCRVMSMIDLVIDLGWT